MTGGIHYQKGSLIYERTKKYEIIKSLAEHADASKERAALILGCTVRHIHRMLTGYRVSGKEFFVHGNKGRKQNKRMNGN